MRDKYMVFEQCYNYMSMFISTDLIFYRAIFRMREIKMMEFTSFASFKEFESSMKMQRIY